MIDQRASYWYAFVTKPRHEKKADEALKAAGIESYLPLKKTLNKWKDRKKWVETPLFSCYIFSKIPYVNRYDVIKIPSVVRIVGFQNQPTPVRSEEITAVRQLLSGDHHLFVHDGPLPGDSVRIKSGPLIGLEGQLVEFRRGRWFVIYIEAIGKSVLVDVNEHLVEKVETILFHRL